MPGHQRKEHIINNKSKNATGTEENAWDVKEVKSKEIHWDSDMHTHHHDRAKAQKLVCAGLKWQANPLVVIWRITRVQALKGICADMVINSILNNKNILEQEYL